MQHIYTTNFCARKETLSISIPVNYEDLNDKNVYVAYKKVFNIKCLSNIEMCSLFVATFWRRKHPISFQIQRFRTDFTQNCILLSYPILHNLNSKIWRFVVLLWIQKNVYRNFATAAKNSIYEISLQSFILAKIGSTSIHCYWISSF